MSSTVIVVPCYNEAGRLAIDEFRDFLPAEDVDFVFVDDGSSDDTAALLRPLALATPDRVELVSLPENLGKAEAVRAGVLRAFERGPRYVGYWDADLATPLAAIADFRSLLEEDPGVDLVLGSRVVLLGRRIERSPARHYLGRVAATLIAFTLGLRIYDTQCGAKLFRASEAMRVLFNEPFVARWLFDVEIVARLLRDGGAGAAARAVELPLMEWNDVEGSKVRPADYLGAAADLIRIHRRTLRSRPAAGPGPPR